MRRLAFVLALACALPAAAQTPPATGGPPPIARMLGGIWRPLPAQEDRTMEAWIAATCEGAAAEMQQVEAALPDPITPEGLAAIRSPRGLIIIPASDDPTRGFIFANNEEMARVASGATTFTAIDPRQGRIDFTDSRGQLVQIQVGRSDGGPMMRMLRGNEPPLTLIGCPIRAG